MENHLIISGLDRLAKSNGTFNMQFCIRTRRPDADVAIAQNSHSFTNASIERMKRKTNLSGSVFML